MQGIANQPGRAAAFGDPCNLIGHIPRAPRFQPPCGPVRRVVPLGVKWLCPITLITPSAHLVVIFLAAVRPGPEINGGGGSHAYPSS